jgi:hypothetical protein
MTFETTIGEVVAGYFIVPVNVIFCYVAGWQLIQSGNVCKAIKCLVGSIHEWNARHELSHKNN